MTTALQRTLLPADRVVALGYCPDCYATGAVALVAPGTRRCRAHLVDQRVLVETTSTGQARLAAPAGGRRRPVYATGVQTPCVSCATVGRDKQGLPRDGAGSDPLCIPCWRGRTDRRTPRTGAGWWLSCVTAWTSTSRPGARRAASPSRCRRAGCVATRGWPRPAPTTST
ncbi:hypothetical protein GCM10029963_78580 [Micromonospora andamanensis]